MNYTLVDRETGRERETDRQVQSMWACMYVCVCVKCVRYDAETCTLPLTHTYTSARTHTHTHTHKHTHTHTQRHTCLQEMKKKNAINKNERKSQAASAFSMGTMPTAF